LADAEVWMTQGSGAIQEWAYGSGSLSYVQSISTPDGYPAVNLLYIGGTGPGLFVTDHYVMNGVPSSNWWFFSTVLQAWVWDNENSGFVLLTSTSQPVYNAYYGIVIIPYRFSAIFELNYPSEEFDGNEYILDDSNDTGQHITTIDSSAATLGAITSAVEQKTSTQFNQVLVFDTLSAGESDQPEPGLTVPGAVYTALGGGLAWASGAGVVTAITYN
jgi:hypothetical protein